MKTVGIIAEYNPFHKGHAYQLQKAKVLTGADYAVIVMSGNFVQRGAPAIVDKYVRTEMALRAGADLVLELPVSYATGSAEAFAQGAVSVLESLGCVDTLCFGSECGDIDALLSCARLFEEEPENYRTALQENLKQGLSYPAARSRAAKTFLKQTAKANFMGLNCKTDAQSSISSVLEKPNNILGIEYCRALLRQNSRIQPLTIQRKSAGYHDLSLETELASASAIRTALLGEVCRTKDSAQLPDSIVAQLPKFSAQLLTQTLEASGFLTMDDFSSTLFHRLLSLTKEELARYQDITEDLAARMENFKYQFTFISAFADLLKTKQLTHTRITRALCHILLNLRQADLETLREQSFPAYARALGFRKSAGPLLSSVKQKGTSPLLVKTADASALLSPIQLALFEQDVFAAHVYEAAKVCKFGAAFTNEYTRSPVILQ